MGYRGGAGEVGLAASMPRALRQLGVEVNPPPDPVAGISGGGTVSVVAVGVESTPGPSASGAPGTARTTGGNSGGPVSEVSVDPAVAGGVPDLSHYWTWEG